MHFDRLNIWQLEAIVEWMRAHDDPSDDTLNTAYVVLKRIPAVDENVVQATTEAGERIVVFSDGSDVTDEYPSA